MNINYKSLILAVSLLFALSPSISAAPGDLDPTFGNAGIAFGDSPGYWLYLASAMAIQPDGKIVMVGLGAGPTDGGRGDCCGAVVRFNPNGSLDTSFGGTGIAIYPISRWGFSAVAIQPDGKIVVAGATVAGTVSLGVVRYNPNGSLDTSFNGSGLVVTPFDGVQPTSITIQTDGKILVAGGFFIVRYNPSGSLDTTFNGNGIVHTSAGLSSLAIQANGKIVAGVPGFNWGSSSHTLVRYNPDGSPDTSFNGTGVVTTPIGDVGSGVGDLAIQPDGKIVVAGYGFTAVDTFLSPHPAALRYNEDGFLDTSFGGTGKILFPERGYASLVEIQANGQIVVGAFDLERDPALTVSRLNPNGSLDSSFRGVIPLPTNDNAYFGGGFLAIQADGKIVIASDYGNDTFRSFVAVRYQGDSISPTSCPNPIDCPEFFVRQHYQDFLNREPDSAGLAFWKNEIDFCGSDAQCVEVKRINVSAAYFLSIEFQQSGYLVYRFYKSAFGNLPGAPVPVRLSDFLPDAQAIGQGVIVNQGNWQPQLETNKQNYANAFVQRSAFTAFYPTSMTPGTFVDTLFANAGVNPTSSERAAAVAEFGSAANTADVAARARALRLIAENSTLQQQEFNRAFVLMQYFSYLRRNPNDAPEPTMDFQGYNFWLNKLDSFNGNYIDAEMVKAFLVSAEYRQRFGP